MRIEREVKRNEYRGDFGPVLGDPIECTRIQFGETELGPGTLYQQTSQDVELRMQITDHRGRVLLVGRLQSILRDEKDGSITLEFEPLTLMS